MKLGREKGCSRYRKYVAQGPDRREIRSALKTCIVETRAWGEWGRSRYWSRVG